MQKTKIYITQKNLDHIDSIKKSKSITQMINDIIEEHQTNK
jgi:hypothetical protein